MKRLILALPLVAFLLVACSAGNPSALDDGERTLISADECNPHIKLC